MKQRLVALALGRDESLWAGVYTSVFTLLALTVINVGRGWDFHRWTFSAMTCTALGVGATLRQLRRQRRRDAAARRSRRL